LRLRRLAAVLALGGCVPATARNPALDPDYAVYSTVLDEVLAETARSAYLVRPQTHGQAIGAGEMISDVFRQLPEAPPSLVADFLERNATDLPIDPARFRTRKPVLLTGDTALSRAMRAQADDDPFPAFAPAEGVLTLSRVGYSADGTRAAVHVLFLCGPRCGGGSMVLLERVGTTWIPLKNRQTVQY
jgi:hypothetical protein